MSDLIAILVWLALIFISLRRYWWNGDWSNPGFVSLLFPMCMFFEFCDWSDQKRTQHRTQHKAKMDRRGE